MNIEDLGEDSDTSDEDFVLDKHENEALPSEEESDGDDEDFQPDKLDTCKGKRGKKSRRKAQKTEPVEESKDTETPKDEDKQKRTAALWADFMKDTGLKRKSSSDLPAANDLKKPRTVPQKETVKVTEVYEFAGEEVKIEKEVSAERAASSSGDNKPVRRSMGGGLKSVLGQLGKKQKITTLEKTKLDWEKFKKDEDLQDELAAYSKSKDGYLERQDFLQRADVRQFEIEKGIRSSVRNK